MTDHDLALVLPTDVQVELLGEDMGAARGAEAASALPPLLLLCTVDGCFPIAL